MYERVELKEGVPVQFLGMYATKWRPEWGEPTVGFRESGVDVAPLVEALRAVEWVRDEADGNFSLYCPWCLTVKPYHAPECKRQAALAAVEEGDDAEGDG